MSAARKYDHDLARDMYADGVSISELARFFGVSMQAITVTVDAAARERHREASRQRYNRRREIEKERKR